MLMGYELENWLEVGLYLIFVLVLFGGIYVASVKFATGTKRRKKKVFKNKKIFHDVA